MSTATLATDRWLTSIETASILRIEPQTLARWRMDGRGPRYRKLNARVVRYRERDVLAYLENSGESTAAE